jgi:hypothetical protein
MKIISSTKWTSDEHCLFNNACIRYGWGRWREIAEMIPTRCEIQVQCHAEKVAKKDPWKKTLLGTDDKLRRMQELQSEYLRAVRSGENDRASAIDREVLALIMSCRQQTAQVIPLEE